MNTKKIFVVMMALLLVVAPLTIALTSLQVKAAQINIAQVEDTDFSNISSSDYLTISTVKVNGDTAEDGDVLRVRRGQSLNLRVTLKAGNNDVNNAEIQAYIAGYRYAKYERELVSDFVGPINLPANNKDSYNLNLEIPVDMEPRDAKLRIVVSDENSPNLIVYNYQLNIEGADSSNAVRIKDFLVSPSSTIEAGRTLSFIVNVENIGDRDLNSVKVKVAIPALNVQAYEIIDELREGETQRFESLLIRIPSDANAGDYEIVATVEFDKYEKVAKSTEITVTNTTTQQTGVNGGLTGGATLVTMPDSVELVKGTTAVFPILIQNNDGVAKTYVVSVSGVSELATASFEPSSVVLVNGVSSKTVYLKLNVREDATIGSNVFEVIIQSGNDSKSTTVLASVKEGKVQEVQATTGTSIRVLLEWALVILIVVLIILSLVLVFTRMKKGKKDEDEEPQTYY